MWQFNGSCDGFNVPRSLELLFRWILCGPRKDSETTAHRNEIDKSVNILSELVMNMIKSNRQLQYDSHRSNDRAYNQLSETPLKIGLRIHLHKSTRSKDLVEFVCDLCLCISYDKIIRIENSITNSVTQRIKENNWVYIPSNIVNYYVESCLNTKIISQFWWLSTSPLDCVLSCKLSGVDRKK